MLFRQTKKQEQPELVKDDALLQKASENYENLARGNHVYGW